MVTANLGKVERRRAESVGPFPFSVSAFYDALKSVCALAGNTSAFVKELRQTFYWTDLDFVLL